MPALPAPHPERSLLHNEIHARPPEPLQAPMAIMHLVQWADAAAREASRAHVAALLREHHLSPPDAHTTHLRVDLGAYRLRWELHTEFVSWTITAPVQGAETAAPAWPDASHAVPRDWLAALPGQCLCALQLWVLPASAPQADGWVRALLHEDRLVASTVADGHGEVYTDFALHADGCSRMLLLTGSMTPRRLGRLVQSLQEIETYRMAALLGLPAARAAGAVLASAERELAALAEAIRTADRDAEPALLDRLTRLAGQVESQYAASHARFSASQAYFALVDKRIDDLAESRLAGMQTLGEFMRRRLAPARDTCAWAVRRQDALSQRVSRISHLLRTRVEIEQQQSSQALLATMNRRQDTQLRLQSTVEGLSVAAITYYMVGLVSYLAKGAQALGWPWPPEYTAAGAVPFIALAVWWSIRKAHHRLWAHDAR